MCLSERSGFFARRQRSIVRCAVAWLLQRGCMLLPSSKKASSRPPCLDNPLSKVNPSRVYAFAHLVMCDTHGSLKLVATKRPSCCSISILATALSITWYVLLFVIYSAYHKHENRGIDSSQRVTRPLLPPCLCYTYSSHHLLCSFTTVPARLLE